MAHKRSEISMQKREGRRFVFRTCRIDFYQAESISTATQKIVEAYLKTKYDEVYPHVWDGELGDLMKGEVLLDARGRGSFQ